MSQRKPGKVNLSEYPLLQIIGKTPLAKIDIFADELPNVEIYAKIETYNPGGSIKDRPVLRMLTEAIASGELTREKVILDSSSGNAGIAYAMIGAALGYKVELVIPNNASEERKNASIHTVRKLSIPMRSSVTMKRCGRLTAATKRIQKSIFLNRNMKIKIIGGHITTPLGLKSGNRRVVMLRTLLRVSGRVVLSRVSAND
jgi:threonine synthase